MNWNVFYSFSSFVIFFFLVLRNVCELVWDLNWKKKDWTLTRRQRCKYANLYICIRVYVYLCVHQWWSVRNLCDAARIKTYNNCAAAAEWAHRTSKAWILHMYMRNPAICKRAHEPYGTEIFKNQGKVHYFLHIRIASINIYKSFADTGDIRTWFVFVVFSYSFL